MVISRKKSMNGYSLLDRFAHSFSQKNFGFGGHIWQCSEGTPSSLLQESFPLCFYLGGGRLDHTQ